MSYLNDPREMAIRPESGITLEEDNRYEEMYHWGAHVLDLCDLPVEEYMKPMTVNVNGGGGDGGGSESSSTKTYSLKFYVDGSLKKSYNLEEGAPIPEYDGSKEGYDFSGWKDASGNTHTTMPASNLTLYGTNTIKKFNVSFKVNDEVLDDYTQTIDWGKKITNIPSSSRTGYTFSGWEPSIPSTVKQDYVFSGTFTKKSYNVTFNISGETSTATFEYDDPIAYPAADSKEGYTICGWTPYYVNMPDINNLVLKAVLSANSYTVSYFINDDLVDSFTVKYGQTIPSKDVPAESGYSFTQWSADTEVVDNKMPASDVNFYTIKTANQYTLSYYVDGVQDGQSETYSYGASVEPRAKHEKEGYTVTDWVFNPELDGVSGSYTMPYYNVEATCETSVNSYPVVITHNNDVIYSGSVAYGTEISTLIPEGYSYTGSVETVPASGITIDADINTYNVTVNLAGKEPFVLPLEYKSDIASAIEDYIETNYPNEMVGHHIETNVPVGATVPARDVQYTAEIVPNEHIITVSGASSVTINYGENILEALEGAIEVGPYEYIEEWQMNGTTITSADTMPDEDVTVVPIIKTKESSVTPVISGETAESAATYDYGTPIADIIEDIIASASPETKADIEDPGYQVDWTVNGSAYTEGMVVEEDEVTVEVTITPKPFKLSFMRRSSAAAPAGVIESGETLYKEEIVYPELPAEIEISGVTYEFKWDDGSVEEGTPMPASAVTVYGEYVEKPVVKTIYWGALNHNVITAITNDSQDVLALSTFADFPADGRFPIEIPADPTYFDHYDNDTDEEFDAYLESAAREPIIVAPSRLDLSEYSGLRGGLQPVSLTKAQDIKISGADYTVWYEFRIDEEYPAAHGYFSEGSVKSLEITLTK